MKQNLLIVQQNKNCFYKSKSHANINMSVFTKLYSFIFLSKVGEILLA